MTNSLNSRYNAGFRWLTPNDYYSFPHDARPNVCDIRAGLGGPFLFPADSSGEPLALEQSPFIKVPVDSRVIESYARTIEDSRQIVSRHALLFVMANSGTVNFFGQGGPQTVNYCDIRDNEDSLALARAHFSLMLILRNSSDEYGSSVNGYVSPDLSSILETTSTLAQQAPSMGGFWRAVHFTSDYLKLKHKNARQQEANKDFNETWA